MLCEIVPEAQPLLQFLIIIGFLGSIGVSLATLAAMRTKQKREVSFAEEYVKRQELKAVTARLDKAEEQLEAIRAEMKEDRQAILDAGERRATETHKRINEVLAAVSEVRGVVSAMRHDGHHSDI